MGVSEKNLGIAFMWMYAILMALALVVTVYSVFQELQKNNRKDGIYAQEHVFLGPQQDPEIR